MNTIWIGEISVKSPSQNAIGVFVGQFNSSGWDANQKVNTAHGGNSGFGTVTISGPSILFDNFEYADGNITSADFRPVIDVNVWDW